VWGTLWSKRNSWALSMVAIVTGCVLCEVLVGQKKQFSIKHILHTIILRQWCNMWNITDVYLDFFHHHWLHKHDVLKANCILQAEPNTMHWKYKEAAHMLCTNSPISHTSVDICPICFPLISKELQKWIGIHWWFTRMFELCRRRMVAPPEGADWVVTTSHFNLLETFWCLFRCFVFNF
jgi:hypothetical protein